MDDSIDITQATTSILPPTHRPDAKTARYDRQLRLWASAGQKSLEEARVLLIGADATGCQALKNLVLPGIAHFTILSPYLATSQDVATNFFLHPDSIGVTVAGEAVRFLKELNPSVEGLARVDDPAELIRTNPDYFLSFTLIIVSNIEPALELELADLLWSASSHPDGPDIPLVAIRNSGFLGRVEIQLREHCVIDSHPDTTHTLRIDQPFTALEEYAKGLDLENIDSMEYSHVPWVVLLVRAGSAWRQSHAGTLPSTSEEKDEFKSLLRAQKKKGDEENYDEALGQAYKVWSTTEVPYELKDLLEDNNIVNITPNSKNLHLLLHTLKRYLAPSPHLLPTSPTLPDMHSSTTSYIALQNLYRAQAATDLQQFKSLLAGVLQQVGLPVDAIPTEEIEGFVKNAGGVGIVKGRPLRESKEARGGLREVLAEADLEDFPLPLAIHLAFLASERYHSSQKSWPLEEVEPVEEIALSIIRETQPKVHNVPEAVTEAIQEMTRGGFSTLPTTAAFLGGVVAQEAIKLITKQYTPLDNTVIVDLINSSLEKYKF
ncbi:NEDD8-activating enzyme E1 regulatory subunit, partial [Tremellales sp. Uapishka_1]